jgi:hypothetical protein
MASPGVAADDPAQAEPDTSGGAVSFDGLRRVGGAARPVSAVGRASEPSGLVPANGKNEGALRDVHAPPSFATALTPSDTIVLNSPYDSPAAAGAAAIR